MREKTKEFAKTVVLLCRSIRADYKEQVLVNQLLRAATSIGANVHEAQYAQSTKDFISKLEIALKEANETEYWVEILYETDGLDDSAYKAVHGQCGSIRRMLISSLNTIKSKLN